MDGIPLIFGSSSRAKFAATDLCYSIIEAIKLIRCCPRHAVYMNWNQGLDGKRDLGDRVQTRAVMWLKIEGSGKEEASVRSHRSIGSLLPNLSLSRRMAQIPAMYVYTEHTVNRFKPEHWTTWRVPWGYLSSADFWKLIAGLRFGAWFNINEIDVNPAFGARRPLQVLRWSHN